MRSRPFVVLYIAVFVATMGISMVSPLLPVYARDLGATGVWVGLTFSIFAVTQTIFSPFAGQLSDKYGRKPFIILGLLLYCVAAVGYLTAGTFVQVMLFRALSGVGTSLIFSVARAYMGDMVPPGFEGRWFGMFQTADIVGFGVGPLVAGTIRTVLGFDAVFIAMALLMASSASIIAVLLPGRPPVVFGATPGEELKAARIRDAVRHRLTIGIAWIMMLISVSFGATLSFLAVRLEDDLGTSSFLIGVAFGAEALTAGASQPLLGRVADRVSRRVLVSAGLGLAGGALFAVGALTAYWPIVGLLILMGAGVSAAQVSAGAMQVVAGREVAMGTVIGIGSAGQGFGVVLGSVAGGLLVDATGIDAAFYLGGAVMLAGIPVFLAMTRGVPITDVEVEEARAARGSGTGSRGVAGQPGGGH